MGIERYRNNYFRLLDAVVAHTGESKQVCHEWWLNHIFPFLEEDSDNFIEDMPRETTTKCLSMIGWNTMANEFRHYCLNKFQIS